MLLDKFKATYSYRNNTYGQAGNGSTSASVSLTKVDMIEGKTYFTVGTGYKNNYVIDTEGFVFAAGSNEYGQLGNSTYEDSYVFTLVGDRNFKILPEAKLMLLGEIEEVTIESNIFNLFDNNERTLTDYNWSSSNTDVATVTDGVIIAQDMGEAIITATDKITNSTATALRVVQPADEQRISSISVNGVEAKLVGENKYEVSVIPNIDGTGTLKVETNVTTDTISINSGTTYVACPLVQDINLDVNPKEVQIKVKAASGKIVDYILTIHTISSDASLKTLTVNNVQATSISSTEFEIIVGNDISKPEVYALATNEKAKVSIDAGIAELKEAVKTVDMTTTIKKTIPIKVTAENGDSVVYTLTIYKEDALTQLESVLVDGIEAVQLNNNTYKAVVAADSDSCVVQAISLYSKADVKINNFASEVNITTRTVATVGTQTIVKIYVTAMELEREYTLVIDKEGTEDVLGLFAVTVNGVEITPVGNIYDAYISDSTDSVDVTAITISDVDKVAIGNNSADIHTTTKTIYL